MSCSDFVADNLTRIRNASRAQKDKVNLPASNLTVRIVEILKNEGFVRQLKVFEDGKKKMVRVHLKYLKSGKAAIQGLQKISKPGLRWHVDSDNIPKVQGGLGIAIMSTSKGVMTDRDARKNGVGGEVLCKVW